MTKDDETVPTVFLINSDELADAFANAEIYGVVGHDHTYSCSTVEEALESYLEYFMSPGCNPLDVIDDKCPVEVEAYERKAPDARWVRNEAERLWEMLQEDWDEEFGDCETGTDWTGSEAMETFAKAILEEVGRFATTQPVWQCEEVAKRSFDYDQVVAMMREYGVMQKREGDQG